MQEQKGQQANQQGRHQHQAYGIRQCHYFFTGFCYFVERCPAAGMLCRHSLLYLQVIRYVDIAFYHYLAGFVLLLQHDHAVAHAVFELHCGVGRALTCFVEVEVHS